MKAIIQHLDTGQTELIELPAPRCRPGHVLIRSTKSLISAGTERMLVEFGKASLIDKARKQPEKVRQVFDKIRTDGLLATIDAVRSKLAQPIQLGYCNSGVVLESGAEGFSVGDRVVSNGPHAEVVIVPQHLCARIPDGVSDEQASFTVMASIGLQGIRLLQPTIGERFAVIGAGLIGLLTIQLLRANGCRVLAVDFDQRKLDIAKSMGAEVCNASAMDPVASGLNISGGPGVDGVIITASTSSNDPVSQAARMCRKRGRIILIGVTGLELNRSEFYHKELSFQVSCSYGPGRYDPGYEERGIDYPLGFVRWTEQRNFTAVLDLMASGRVDVGPLISHRFALDEVDRAYEVVAGAEPSIGIVLRFADESVRGNVHIRSSVVDLGGPAGSKPTIGLIGSGNYATMVLAPALKAGGACLHTVACNGGLSGLHVARKFGFRAVTTEVRTIIDDPVIDTVVIATRHNTHAGLVCSALAAGKHVFVEKPLALTHADIDAVESALGAIASAERKPVLMVGFNRRFAPQIVRLVALLSAVPGPKAFVATINAGAIPPEHWTQDLCVGGGRIIGEACHFIDLLRFLAGHRIASHHVVCMATPTADSLSIQLRFAEGSIGTINYLANGPKSFPKERIEVFAGGGVIQLDNFRRMTGFGWRGFSRMNLWRQDKGQKACAAAFLQAIRNGTPGPIPCDQIIEVSRVSIDISQSARS